MLWRDPVLDRLRGVMRVGCSGLCANQPVCRVRRCAATFDFHAGSDARSEESSRWAATRAAAALLACACCRRCSGEAYDSTGPERVGGPSTWLWPVHSPSPSHCNNDKRWTPRATRSSNFKQGELLVIFYHPLGYTRGRGAKLYTGNATTIGHYERLIRARG